jgi:hypothetical protein
MAKAPRILDPRHDGAIAMRALVLMLADQSKRIYWQPIEGVPTQDDALGYPTVFTRTDPGNAGSFLYLDPVGDGADIIPVGGSGDQEVIANNTGGPIAAGDLVYLPSWDATNAMREAEIADSDDPAKQATHVCTEAIATGATGVVAGSWIQRDVDTSGYSAADVLLYLTTTGTTTNTSSETIPTAKTDFGQEVALVGVKSATVGVIVWYPGAALVNKHGNASLQADTISADATGRAIMEDDLFDAATLAAKVVLPEGNMLVGNGTDGAVAFDASAADVVPVGNGTTPVAMTLPTTGLVAKTALNTAAGRTITAPAAGITIADGDGVAGNPTLSLADDLAALEALDATAGLLAKTAADTYARRTVTAGSLSLTVANGDGQAGNPTIDTAQDIRATASPTFATMTLTGDLLVQGSSVIGDFEHFDVDANYLVQNTGYTTAVAVTGGRVINYLPTATADDTVGAGVFTAGVNGASDPTITTQGAATFAASDIVMVDGADDIDNNGLCEVVSHAGNVLTLRSTANGVTNRIEAFTLDQLTTNAGDVGATITKVTVAVDRAGTDGRFEAAAGAVTGLVYSDYLLASDIGTSVQARDAMLDALAALVAAGGNVLHFTAADTPALLDLGGGAAYSLMYRSGAGTVGLGTIQAHGASTSGAPSAADTASATATSTAEERSGFVHYVDPIAEELVTVKAALQVANGACAIVGQPDYPRVLTVDLAAGAAIDAGTLTIVGPGPSGEPLSEVVSLIVGAPALIYTDNAFSGVDSATVAGLVGGAGMTISIGVSKFMGLPGCVTPASAGFAIYKLNEDSANQTPTSVDAAYGTFQSANDPNAARDYTVWFTYEVTPTQAGHVHGPGTHTHDTTPDAHTIA